MQTRGFNNFSYADIASELGITTASLHYHFPGKAELGQALITRYAQRFSQALTQIEQGQPNARAKLEAYAGLYADVLRGKRMCMCGILAAEYQTLPKPMRTRSDPLLRRQPGMALAPPDRGPNRPHAQLHRRPSKTSPRTSSAPSKERCSSPAPTATFTRFNAAANQLLASLSNTDQTPRKRRSTPSHH